MEDTPRNAVLRHLTALADDLDRFEQTTHGLILKSPDFVGGYLARVLSGGSAYDTSNLAQLLRSLLREYGG